MCALLAVWSRLKDYAISSAMALILTMHIILLSVWWVDEVDPGNVGIINYSTKLMNCRVNIMKCFRFRQEAPKILVTSSLFRRKKIANSTHNTVRNLVCGLDHEHLNTNMNFVVLINLP